MCENCKELNIQIQRLNTCIDFQQKYIDNQESELEIKQQKTVHLRLVYLKNNDLTENLL